MVGFFCNFIFSLRAAETLSARPDSSGVWFLFPQRADQMLLKSLLFSLFTSGVHAPLSAKSVENSSHLLPLGYAANNRPEHYLAFAHLQHYGLVSVAAICDGSLLAAPAGSTCVSCKNRNKSVIR
jgi:hypothetical protein